MKLGHRFSKKTIPLLLLVVLSIMGYSAHTVAAISNTPTYVLGVSSPTDPLIVDLQGLTSSLTILPGVSSLTLVGSNSILFVDGAWLQSVTSTAPTILSLVAQEPLKGVPTIVIRGTPSLLADSISGLVRTKALGLPLISEGTQVIGTLPDGTRQAMDFQVIAGFDYAVQAEFNWAQQLLSSATTSTSLLHSASKTASKASSSLSASTTSASSFTFVGQLITSTGDNFAPVARITYTFSVYELQNSGSSSYKWFNFFNNETLQPGISLYNSGWRTSEEADSVRVGNLNTNLLVDHGPRLFSTVGPSTISYAIGTQAGALNATVTANQTQSYFLKNTNVTDTTLNGSNVGWDHKIDSRTSAGKLTFTIIPGWTDRVTINDGINYQASFTSSFDNFSSNSVQTSSITNTISVFGG